MIGRTLSHYSIEDRLGQGGMGEVYAARDTRLGRAVAIKILPPSTARREEMLRRFISEAKTASSLNHPNIVIVHDVDQHDGVHFIVMEKIDGQPLSAKSGARMPVEEFLAIALQITAALGASHDAGIVHRDIKPGNVMLTRNGTVKVVDFGLARLAAKPIEVGHDDATMQWDGETPLTAPGTIIGTVAYMSPEQVQGLPADARSDVFSLGVLFHELLAGAMPFLASTPVSTIASILRDPAPSIASLRNDVPRAITNVIAKCLEKDAQKRYADAAEIHRELAAIHESMQKRSAPSGLAKWAIAAGLAIVAIAAVLFALWWRGESRRRWARDEALPRIDALWKEERIVPAWVLAREALAAAPEDAQVQQKWANLTFPTTIVTDPPGANVEIASYRNGSDWVPVGTTPLTNARLPFLLVRMRLTAPSYAPSIVAPQGDPLPPMRLHRASETPANMVFVDGGTATFEETRATLPAFWIDRHEVTNREYKAFVDAGGYRKAELWPQPFVRDGKTLTFGEAMALFVDETGRAGPATWELGSYHDGKAEHPVDGISWYEASAFAKWSGKSLPTVFHWARAAAHDGIFSDILAASNFSNKGTTRVESLPGLGQFGTYDMAGNVKEWCANASGAERFILGGAYSDASYQFVEPDARSPFARAPGFGFRCVKQSAPFDAKLLAEVRRPERTPILPVDDATFRVFARLYDYDRTPLDARVEEIDDSHAAWRRERIVINTAYGERMPVILFLPKNARPPYQTIVFYPGSDAIYLQSSRDLMLHMAEFWVRSGRALVYPIYRGTYERQLPAAAGPNATRERRIQRVQDARRTLDYLETRKDVDRTKLGYYGLSLGANNAPFVLATDSRFRMAVLFAGGLTSANFLPEVQQQNFLPRVTVPVLQVGGRYDFSLPVETTQKPFFALLGTPADRKKLVLFDGGHIPARFNDTVKEMLNWADRWLGPVETR